MGKDYGEPLRHDPSFNGPIHNRSCTDIFWLILFVLFLGAWAYVGYYSVQHGDVNKLLAPIDSRGQRCGLDSGVENKRYLVFFNIALCLVPGVAITGCPTPQVCVSQCPDETIPSFSAIIASEGLTSNIRSKMVCTDDVNTATITQAEALEHIRQEKCASYVLQSQSVMQRCFINITEAVEKIGDFIDLGLNQTDLVDGVSNIIAFEQLASQIVQDLVQSKWYMAGALVAVVLVCFIYILLLRWVITPLVWTSIIALIGLLAFATYLCYKNYAYFKAHPVSMSVTTNLKGYAESIFSKDSTWLIILILVAMILVILLLVVIFLRSRIVVATALIKEGSKAFMAVKSTVILPILSWIVQCFVLAYGVLVLMYLLSVGESAFRVVNLSNDTNCNCQYNDYDTCDPLTFSTNCYDSSSGIQLPCRVATCHFTGIDSPTLVTYLHLVNLLGFFWAMFFISGVGDMMLAGTFSTWYWTFKKRNLPFFTLTSSIWRTLRYHLGTVAFGSLIIAIVRVIRVLLEYIDHKVKKFDNPLTRCILCCCKCVCWCLENFLKFINKNAYIMCAIHGKNFCTSAKDSFSLLMRNIVRVVVLDKVTDFIFFLSKLLISLGVGFAVYYLLQWSFVYDITQGAKLHYNYIPAIILSIATYLICTIFFNVYAMAVDTLFLCFLEDCERNDGSPEKPYFMSTGLMNILGKRNKIRKD